MKSSNKYDFIMLIDDNEVDNFVNKEIIKRSGIANRIDEFTSAVKALEYLKNIAENGNGQTLPDLIFLDINMPVLDGFEFMQEFEQINKELPQNVNVVILTSSDNPDDVRKAENYPLIKDYIVKPLKPDRLERI